MTEPLTVIIPALNEEQRIAAVVGSAARDRRAQIIVVDGGSADRTRQLARQAGALVLESPPGRAGQANAGAAAATGTLLLFLHGDTILPPGYGDLIRTALNRPGVAAGAFSLGIDGGDRRLALIAAGATLRSRLLQLPYGDQALFLPAATFSEVGGYPLLPIMEDLLLVRRLCRIGRVITLREQVMTSARRWQHLGLLRTTLINQLIVAGYLLGVRPEALARWYQRRRD
jgi:rSAM/selenodomain-associated transferase 2